MNVKLLELPKDGIELLTRHADGRTERLMLSAADLGADVAALPRGGTASLVDDLIVQLAVAARCRTTVSVPVDQSARLVLALAREVLHLRAELAARRAPSHQRVDFVRDTDGRATQLLVADSTKLKVVDIQRDHNGVMTQMLITEQAL